jgi:hypothetical protein
LSKIGGASAKKRAASLAAAALDYLSLAEPCAPSFWPSASTTKNGAYLNATPFNNGLVGLIFFDFFKVFLAMLFSHT